MARNRFTWLAASALFIAIINPVTLSTINVEFKNEIDTFHGVGFPDEVVTTLNSQVHMKLTTYLSNQEKCTLREPNGVQHELLAGTLSDRFQKLENGCGVSINNIIVTDNGRWKLTSSVDNDAISGFTDISIVAYSGLPISEDTKILIEGENYSKYNLSYLPTEYCVVKRPPTEELSVVSGYCEVNIDRASKAMQGDWTVSAGVPGMVEEIHIKHNMRVERGQINAGFVYDDDARKLHIYCNPRHINATVDFCRFLRQSDEKGFRLTDGLGDGHYSYYGKGLRHGECGITVHQVTSADIDTWRCSVGLVEQQGNNAIKSVAESIVKVDPNIVQALTLRAFHQKRNGDSEIKVISARNKNLNLRCQSDTSLTYCWFKHPNGTQFTPITGAEINNDNLFWWPDSSISLETGECGITFREAIDNDIGLWECHMGGQVPSIERVQNINVRITGALAAEATEISANTNQEVTISCITASSPQSLKYCRFSTPAGVGFNIDDRVNRSNPIMDRYYFKEGAKLYQGDCSITISSVQPEDFGVWLCAAKIELMTEESHDFILLIQNSNSVSGMSVASSFGIAIGIMVVIVIAGVGFVAWRRRNTMMAHREPQPVPPQESIEMAEQPKLSYGSGSSVELMPESPRPSEAISPVIAGMSKISEEV